MRGQKIYLAIPYSGMEEESFKIANETAAELMIEGHIVYSPISHNHPIAKERGLPTGWEYWAAFDEEFIKWCDELYVINIGEDGHKLIEKSKGCQAEIKIAKKLGKEIKVVHY